MAPVKNSTPRIAEVATSSDGIAVPWGKRLLGAALVTLLFIGLDRVLHATLIDLVYNTIIRICVYAILAASLNLVNGITGQFSLGHAAFMVIGAYTGGEMSILASTRVSGLPGWEGPVVQAVVFVMGIVAGAVTAALAGLLVGLPTLRLRGDYLAIATLGFGEITRVILQACEPLGGATGLNGVPLLTTVFWALLVATGSIILLRNLQWSGPGRDFMAVREDEVAAAAVGVDVVRAKVVAFIVAAALAGAAGVLLIHLNRSIEPKQAGFLYSIEIVVMVVLGGMGSLTGAILGAAVLMSMHAVAQGWSVLNDYSRYESVIYPALLIALMLLRREGLLGDKELGRESFSNFFSRWRKTERL